jgi:phosphoglycolate phosphatase-like HAD superfamily hydrolase
MTKVLSPPRRVSAPSSRLATPSRAFPAVQTSRLTWEPPTVKRMVLLDPESGLLDTREAVAHSWHDAFQEAGYPSISLEQLRSLYGAGAERLVSLALGIPAYQSEWRRIVDIHSRIFRDKYVPKLSPFPGVRRLLQSMKEDGLRRIIATPASPETTSELLNRAGVTDLIDDVVCAPSVRSKPHPDLHILALRQFRADRKQAVVLGDTPYHAIAAARAELDCVAFLTGGWSESALFPSIAFYEDPSHLAERYSDSPLAAHNWRSRVM